MTWNNPRSIPPVERLRVSNLSVVHWQIAWEGFCLVQRLPLLSHIFIVAYYIHFVHACVPACLRGCVARACLPLWGVGHACLPACLHGWVVHVCLSAFVGGRVVRACLRGWAGVACVCARACVCPCICACMHECACICVWMPLFIYICNTNDVYFNSFPLFAFRRYYRRQKGLVINIPPHKGKGCLSLFFPSSVRSFGCTNLVWYTCMRTFAVVYWVRVWIHWK